MKFFPIDFYNKTKKILKLSEVKNKIPLVVILNLFSTILELFGIALLIPITSVFIDSKNEFSEKIINIFNLGNNTEKLIIILLSIYFLIILIKNVLLTYIEYFKVKFIHHVHKKIGDFFYSQFLNSPIEFFFNKNSNFLTHLMSIKLPNFIATLLAFSALLSEVILCSFILILLVTITPISAVLIGLLMTLIIGIYIKILKNHLYKFGLIRDEHEALWLKNFSETLGFLKEINIFNSKKYFNQQNYFNLSKFIDAKKKITFLSSIGKYFFETIAVIFLIFFLYIATRSSGSFIDTLPLMAAYIAAAVKFLPSMNRISHGLQYISFNFPTTQSVLDELNNLKKRDLKHDTEKVSNEKITFENLLSVKNIDFKYPESKTIIKNLSFDVKKGETVAIIGESGSGKSTLVEIMCGFLNPTKGEITIDHKPIKNSLDNWKVSIGYVTQNTFILNDTLRNNIGLFDIYNNQINDEKVIESLKQVGLSQYLNETKNGLDTILYESGKSLSGGQKQRINIARNLYKQSEVIFFDEPTSSLDEETEDELLKELSSLNKNKDKTFVIVTHKKKVANFCDKIIDLDEMK